MNIKKNIIHLIPSDAIGGVETAAKTTVGIKSNKYIFKIKYLSKQKNRTSLFSRIISIFEILNSSLQVINDKPDFLIVSLWKSCLSAIIIKFFKPNVKIILFLHLPKSLNCLDFYLTFITSRSAFQILGDSLTTLENRSKELNIKKNTNKKALSFLAYKLDPNEYQNSKPNFIFWGRLEFNKRIDLAINLFHEISKEIKDTKFTIIGPDCGQLNYLKKLRANLNLQNRIIFIGVKEIYEIKKIANDCLFFLQLSDLEGLSMSVVESMQLGLIPIVTQVGEIKNYCIHNKNSIIYKNKKSTKDIVLNLIKNPKKLNFLHKNVIHTWSDKKTYKQDLKSYLDSLT